jgi:hypothetical protein
MRYRIEPRHAARRISRLKQLGLEVYKMKLKSLLFGSAAAMMVVTGAQAADLPAAEPVEYVRVCDAFGTGFFYIPGTDTCLKISGYARFEAAYVNESMDEAIGFSDNDILEEDFDNFTTRARGEVQFDARTMTDLGLLRSYVALRGTNGHGSIGDAFNIDKAWLSLANDTGTLTAGHHGSFFDFFGGSALDSRIGQDDPTISVNLLAYTFVIGNGVSASVSMEDQRFRRNNIAGTATTSTSTVTSVGGGTTMASFLTGTTDSWDGQEWPDFVANIRVDQGWGSAQIMGAVGQLSYTGVAAGINEDEIGWAAGAGLSVGVPGTGITFDIQGTYAEGLVSYATTGNGAPLFDATVNVAGTGLDLTEAWGIHAALGADVSSNVSVALNGSYAQVDHGGATGAGFTGDLDYDTWVVAGTVHWKPVSGLTISGEVAYEAVDWDSSATASFPVLSDQDIWGAMMRINRTF